MILRFHWRTMLETERAPDSASDEVVLADTSAPESSMGGFRPTRPAARSDMGLARRLSAETWGPKKRDPVSRVPRAWTMPRSGVPGGGTQGPLSPGPRKGQGACVWTRKRDPHLVLKGNLSGL